MLPMGTTTFGLVMNKDSFNKLPKKAQDIFLDHQEYTARLWADEMDKSLDEHQKKMEADSKHHFYFPNAAEIEEWKKVLNTAVDKWLSEDPVRPKLLGAYKKELAETQK
jgi:TRAP-type C4-dicarboxylate transport system substrate-binding protein